jgi:hypothetical protein
MMKRACWKAIDPTRKGFTSFYRSIIKWDRFYHVSRFLHFSDNKNEPDKKIMTDKNYDVKNENYLW